MDIRYRLGVVRRSATQLSDCCFAAATGLAVAGAVAFLVNRYVVPWPAAELLLVAAGFYFVLGVCDRVRAAN
jgi:hypothetical protein